LGVCEVCGNIAACHEVQSKHLPSKKDANGSPLPIRYKVNVSIFVDTNSADEAEILVTQMLCGTEMMSRMWQVDSVEVR
jgi:hypothetical protein